MTVPNHWGPKYLIAFVIIYLLKPDAKAADVEFHRNL
jgi:hypothetical protein